MTRTAYLLRVRVLAALEIELETKLNHPRSSAGRGNSSKGCDRDVGNRIRVVHPVEGVEHFHAYFTADLFFNRDEFDYRKIDVFLSRTGQEVSLCITERMCGIKSWIVHCANTGSAQQRTGNDECALIEIIIQTIRRSTTAQDLTIEGRVAICATEHRIAGIVDY